ncbi:MAG: glycosyltransferase family 4 protein [Bacteroidetes bacterium]|nr:glycosyltransferase family 4 protein [Bacteroidota bacterium]
MKVLYLTPGCFDKGGISRYNRYQIQTLRDLYGNESVRVLSLAGPQPGDFEEPFHVHWHAKGPDVLSKIKFTLQLVYQTLIWTPDLILTAHVNFSGLAKLVSKIRNTKTLLNTYGLEVWSGFKKLPFWGLKNTDHVISDCYYTARYLESEGLRKKGTVKVIWDCVDLDRFFPNEKVNEEALAQYHIPDPREYKLIVSLGRISKKAAHKGYDRLIQVFSVIHKRFPEARLVLAGKGDWIGELREMADKLGVMQKITFTGMIYEKHLVDIYRMAYVFSLASDRGKGRGEGIPLTPLEAMACGVPIIVGNQDGSQEAVIGEENGFVIDPMDINNHAEKLAQLLRDQKLRDEKAKNAVALVHRYFSYLEFREKHKKLFDEIGLVSH